MKLKMIELREALEASWDQATSYQGAMEKGNPALGQCYPTSRVVQMYLPEVEIVKGEVWTGTKLEKHFWNILNVGDDEYHIDFTWQQFPFGSSVRSFKIRDRKTLGDSQPTIQRCELLRMRVEMYLENKSKKKTTRG